MTTIAGGMPDTTRTADVLLKPARSEEKQAQAQRNRRVLEIALAAGVPLVALLLWEIAATAGWIDARLFPAPSRILEEGRAMVSSGVLFDQTLVTVRRIVQGFAIGAAAGIAAGLITGNIPLVRSALEPTFNGLYVIPKLALFPVFLTIFGLGDAPKIALGAWAVFFYVWLSSMEAFSQVPDGYREAARSLGLSRWQLFKNVLLPGALPQIFVGARMAMNVAILVVIAAEMVASSDGLGYLINHSRQLFANSQMYVAIIFTAIMGIILATCLSWLGRRFTPWVPTRRQSVLAG